MRNKAVLLLIVFAAFIGIDAAYAALPIKDISSVSSLSLKQEERPQTASEDIFNSIESKLPDNGKNHKHNHPHVGRDNRPGWPGILALIFGILSIYGGFIPALIFGIIGVDKKYKNRGLALAGLIICALEVLLIIAFILAFSGVL